LASAALSVGQQVVADAGVVDAGDVPSGFSSDQEETGGHKGNQMLIRVFAIPTGNLRNHSVRGFFNNFV
jgi:hypothetical protein